VAAAPWIKIFMPLLIGATASSADKVLALQSATRLMSPTPFHEKIWLSFRICTLPNVQGLIQLPL
jgi:hypothetical protein